MSVPILFLNNKKMPELLKSYCAELKDSLTLLRGSIDKYEVYKKNKPSVEKEILEVADDRRD